ncbi:MAG: hypothetical protein WAM42_26580, partial [Candidatus Nitrosopolaris sp.]
IGGRSSQIMKFLQLHLFHKEVEFGNRRIRRYQGPRKIHSSRSIMEGLRCCKYEIATCLHHDPPA